MDVDPNTHITDLIETYLAGGLSGEELAAFQAHVRDCAVCASALRTAEEFDGSIASILSYARPDSGLEDRLLARFRASARRPRLHPNVRRAAVGIAATIVLGGFGYVASTAIEEGRLPLIGSHDRYASAEQNASTVAEGGVDYFENRSGVADRVKSSSNARQMGVAMRMYDQSPRAPEDIADQLGRRLNDPASGSGTQQNSFNTAIDLPGISSPKEMAEEAESKLGKRIQSAQGPSSGGEPGVVANLPIAVEQSDQSTSRSPAGGGFAGGRGPVQKVEAKFDGPNDAFRDSITGGASLPQNRSASESAPANKPAAQSAGYAPPAAVSQDAKDNILQPVDYDGNPETESGKDKKGVALYFKPAQVSKESLASLAQAPPKDAETKQELDEKAEVPALQPAQGQGGGSGGQPSTPAPVVADPATGRKVIRSGDMTFEVDSFDSTVATITKIVGEEGGFVSTTDSDKLANGKVKGTVVLRVPPDDLDTLVLKLRGIGDLKSQKINAHDITKQYTDLQSELRAARAMEDRLLDIIKTGKGEVKDLLEAEKQLGVWREKIEQVEGEMRYDDNLVSLSTLSVTLIEKDIKTAAYASETEQVTMALETPNVESAYDKAKEAIAAAKGRIVQSDLQQHEAGQYSGTITAALPPDAADGVIARLRQLEGRVANFQRQRAQKNQGGTGAPLDLSKLHREDVSLSLTMYNLANVEPRRSVSVLLAAPSVDESYRKVLDAISSAGGRVVTASVNRGNPEQSTAVMKFDIASEKADVLLAAVRAAGEVAHSETSDNPDTQNVTEAKRGFVLTIESLAAAAPRETQQLKLAASSVPDGFNDLLNAVLSKSGRIVSSQLNQQDRESVTGVLEFEVSRDASAAIDAAINKAGDVIARNVSRSQDTQNTVDSKVQFHVDLLDALSLAPRQKTTLAVEVADVSRATRDLISAAVGAGGRSAGSTESSLDHDGNLLTRVVVEVPLAKAGSIVDQVTAMGTVRVNETSTDEHAAEGRLARARIEVTFGNSAAVVGGQENIWDAVRHGLAVSGTGLRWSLTMIVIGFCFVAPWALIVWIPWRIFRRRSTVVTAPAQAEA